MVRTQAISAGLTIEIDRSVWAPNPEHGARIDAAWREMCELNPRYFNAPILVYESFDPTTGTIHASVAEYKHHAVQDSINLGLSLLAVTGVLVAPHDGRSRYLLGQRSPTTHRYGYLWEFGPCGGIDVPDGPPKLLDHTGIVRELMRETMEETGIDLDGSRITPIALVHDDGVGSTDIVLSVDLESVPDIDTGWEYEDTRWVTLDELNAWRAEHPDDFIPTAHAIASLLDRSAD